MGFFKTMATSAGWAAGQKLVNGGDKGGDGGKAMAEVESKRLDAEIAQAEKSAVKDELDAIVSVKFEGSADEISDTLNALFTKAAQLPTGLAAIGDDTVKARKKAIIEKVEFGIMKLNRLDQDSAAYFQKKFDELQGKKKK